MMFLNNKTSKNFFNLSTRRYLTSLGVKILLAPFEPANYLDGAFGNDTGLSQQSCVEYLCS